jgi:DNA-directed RNA polymerase subunit H (RpoH/RPB5)
MTTTKTTTTRRRKTPVATPEPMPLTHELVSISDTCKAESVTEQAFRLALMDIRPDDFDTIKSIPQTQSEQVLATLTATKPALPAPTSPTDTTPETAETSTPQALQPALETAPNMGDQPQNSDIVASSQNSQVAAPGQPKNQSLIPTALDELIASAEEDIALADLVLIYRNQQISQNTQARDGELVQQLRQSRTDNRAKTFDALRELNSRQPIAPDLEELPESLSSEIDRLALELGKQLSLGR